MTQTGVAAVLVKLCPRAYVVSIADLHPEYFKTKGIKGIILDLDNTLVPWRAGIMEPEMAELIANYKKAGLRLCIVSNAFNRRVADLLEPLEIPAVTRARKPLRKSFQKALRILGTTPQQTAVIGDQIFTDILGGNRLGLYTVLVVPINKREFIGTRLVRILEKLLLHRLAARGIIEMPR